jgi:hypothetical protein
MEVVTFPITAGGTSAVQASSSKVLQVVQGVTQTQTSTTSSSYIAATNLSLSITPTSSTSKILLFATMGTIYNNGSGSATSTFTFYKNGSDIAPTTQGFLLNSFYNAQGPSSMQYLDSPATTSALTYQVYFKTNSNTTSVGGSNGGVFTSSTITLMEIAA